MELLHALLCQGNQLIGGVGVLAVDDDVEGRLHVFEQEDHSMDVD
ncbi:hypothetical protein [Croceicoccus marinus]|nr:hypothetical protein [Croceicoccus marinus]